MSQKWKVVLVALGTLTGTVTVGVLAYIKGKTDGARRGASHVDPPQPQPNAQA